MRARKRHRRRECINKRKRIYTARVYREVNERSMRWEVECAYLSFSLVRGREREGRIYLMDREGRLWKRLPAGGGGEFQTFFDARFVVTAHAAIWWNGSRAAYSCLFWEGYNRSYICTTFSFPYTIIPFIFPWTKIFNSLYCICSINYATTSYFQRISART